MTATQSATLSGMALPPLREELSLHQGPTAPDGAPTWTLADPVRNSFFQLSWAGFEILARWALGSPAAILDQVRAQTTLDVDEDDFQDLLWFLSSNQLLRVGTPHDSARFAALARARRQRWWEWLLHHYLFIRIPLIRPDGFLDRTVGWVGWIYSRGFAWATLCALALGLILISRQWEGFRTTLVDTLTLQGAVHYALALSLVKTVHEFAHAYTAKRLGCRVPTMGVAFLVLWPVLYTDVNTAWTLPRRRDRLAVGGAGIMAELTIAAWSGVAWGLLPDGPLRQMAFVLAALTWVSSLAVNLSPFMRFDGYFLLMDAVNLPNLHHRAFAAARWWLRETLFGLGEAPPEPLPEARRHLLVAFAVVVWAYRLSLFLGIAALVYHFFIKAVGIGLFCVEIGWFVVLPVWQELREWHRRRGAIAAGKRGRVGAAAVCLLLLVLALPWHGRISAPAMLKGDGAVTLFVPTGARLAAEPPPEGRHVAAGETLFQFEQPDDNARRQAIDARIQALSYEAQSISYEQDFRDRIPVIQEQLAAARSERAALDAQTARLRLTAPVSGTVVDRLPDLHVGDWISPREALATLKPDVPPVVDAYVAENDVARLTVGAAALFYPDVASRPAVPCVVTAVDPLAAPVLTDPELANTYGGGIAVRGKPAAPVPVAALYRVRLTPRAPGATPPLDAELRGTVRVAGRSESLLERAAKSVAAVILRESGM